MSEEMDRPGFYLEYPVYVLADEFDEVVFITGPRGTFLPLFTDGDTADSFIADRPLPDHRPAEVPTREDTRAMLASAGKAGVHFVTMDPAATGTRQAVTFPLDHFLNCLAPSV